MSALNRQEFSDLFNDVWDQLCRLQTAWTLYFCLYGELRTVERLRALAPVTFGALQNLLIEGMYISTHRLLDGATARGTKTASIEGLIQRLPDEAIELRRRLKKDLAKVRRRAAPVSDWRD